MATYRAEPYVASADVYALAPHTGRGGWSWYTGSAGWMYRLILESLLGLRLEVDKLYFEPRIPAAWDSFKLHYRFRETVYYITVRRAIRGKPGVTVDGAEQPDMYIHLVDDHAEHRADVNYVSV
jgi:cellobiose phosphorylase